MSEAILSGGCLCGAVRYHMAGDPIDAGFCHCRLCQRASGAPVVAWATFRFGDFILDSGNPTVFNSSADAVRGFCGKCGTPIQFHKRVQPQRIDITVASLDDPDRVPLEYHIWMMSRRPWLHIVDDLPRYQDGGPDVLA